MASAFPATLFMIHKHVGSGEADKTEAFRRLAIANANRGGENVATGALMGALVGAHVGYSNLPQELLAGLAKSQRAQLEEEVEAFLKASPLLASL